MRWAISWHMVKGRDTPGDLGIDGFAGQAEAVTPVMPMEEYISAQLQLLHRKGGTGENGG